MTTRPHSRSNACTELAQMEVLDRLRERQAARFAQPPNPRSGRSRRAAPRPSVLGDLRRLGAGFVACFLRSPLQ